VEKIAKITRKEIPQVYNEMHLLSEETVHTLGSHSEEDLFKGFW
jgi:hypothetical protein